MSLQFLLFVLLQASLVESLAQAYGNLGGNVTLLSGADPSWRFISIHWSIFSNNTWIASYVTGKENLERVPRYKGRLHLNSSSGDLTILNLSEQDAMEYTVDLINDQTLNSKNKINLTVRQPLQKPTIEIYNQRTHNSTGSCRLILRCSSPDNEAKLSWTKPSDMTAFKRINTNKTFLLLGVSLFTTWDQVDFTCTSKRSTQEASADITAKCDGDDMPQPEPGTDRRDPYYRERYSVAVIASAITASFLSVTFMIIRRRRNSRKFSPVIQNPENNQTKDPEVEHSHNPISTTTQVIVQC